MNYRTVIFRGATGKIESARVEYADGELRIDPKHSDGFRLTNRVDELREIRALLDELLAHQDPTGTFVVPQTEEE